MVWPTSPSLQRPLNLGSLGSADNSLQELVFPVSLIRVSFLSHTLPQM